MLVGVGALGRGAVDDAEAETLDVEFFDGGEGAGGAGEAEVGFGSGEGAGGCCCWRRDSGGNGHFYGLG